jgi:aminopeptidase N
MNTDALVVGRPIRQPITDSGNIDASFDAITYGKGGQVVDMIESYLGRETFQRGVQLHLRRFAAGGTASANDFFESLGQAAGDQRVVTAMRSFVDQQGVPLVTFRRERGRLVAAQSRYAPLGAQGVPATQWVIPLCVRTAQDRSCTLLDRASAPVPVARRGWYIPNAGGHGYYRFDLPAADWDALIAAGPQLTPAEALAAIDSLWGSFRAGRVGPGPAGRRGAQLRPAQRPQRRIEQRLRLRGWSRPA